MVNNEDGEETTSRGNEQEVFNKTDNEEGEETMPRGNEWEVVSLTASTYAAAPGPRGDESIHEEKDPTLGEDCGAETSRALFMSGHFVFPPSQHENLPIESENLESSKGVKEDDAGELNVDKESKTEKKEEENWSIEGFNVPEKFPGIPFLEEKGTRTSIQGPELDESTTLHHLAVDDKEQNVYGTAKFGSFHSETEIGGSAIYGESVVSDFVEPSDHILDPSSFISRTPKSGEEDESDDSKLPCGAWWKRRMVSLCAQVKDTNTFWSVFVAAAVMGLVILGQRWQQERWEVLQQRWQLSVGDEVCLLFFFLVKI